ncbi:MAG: hypothetical protein WCA39_01930 [Nitrososphaeraceae archaeon]
MLARLETYETDICAKRGTQKAEIFGKIEPYLAFLNVHQLERQAAYIRTKVEKLDELNQSLTQGYEVKTDAIAQLSGQVMALTVRMPRLKDDSNHLI